MSDLIHAVWQNERTRKAKIRKSDVAIILQVMVTEIIKGLIEERKVKLMGLFTLDVRKMKGRKIRNWSGKLMKTDDYYKVGLKPSKKLKRKLEELK